MRPVVHIVIALLLLIIYFSQTVYAANRSIRRITVQDTQGGHQEINLYSESHALLIGVSGYNNGWPRLDAIPAELDKVEQLLKAKGFSVTRVDDPDSSQLQQVFEDFVRQHGYDSENRLLFFYSGHGHTRKNGSKGYLVPIDAPNPNTDERLFLHKALPMSKVLGWARDIEAKHAMFLFDSCFSGTIFKQKDLPKPPSHITGYAAKPVRQFITAGSANEPVPAKSTFTPAFIDALEYGLGDFNKDGYVSGTELGQFLQAEVPRHTRQHPQYGKISDYELSRGDFIFLAGGFAEDQNLPPHSDPPAETIQTGQLKVESDPAGAAVYVNNKKQDQTTPTLLADIKAGEKTVRVEKSGYLDAEKQTTVRKGRQATVSFMLRKEVQAKARLTVRPDPANGRVRILNIKPRYQQGMELAPGRYHVEVSAVGYVSKRQWFTLEDGVDLDFDVRLDNDKLQRVKDAEQRARDAAERAEQARVRTVLAARLSAPVESGSHEIKRDGRFIAYDNGTVKDSKTGLIWAAKDNGSDIDWEGAKRYCLNYSGGGYTDWRMPTQDELWALYKDGIRTEYEKGKHIISLSNWWVWSSKTRGSEAFFVDFDAGSRGWVPQFDTRFYRILPVRGGR